MTFIILNNQRKPYISTVVTSTQSSKEKQVMFVPIIVGIIFLIIVGIVFYVRKNRNNVK